MNRYRRLCVTFALFGILISNSMLQASDFVPSFLQVGKRYSAEIRYGDFQFTVLIIGDQGWIKVEGDEQILWLNTNMIPAILEVSPEDEKAFVDRGKQKQTMADMRAIATACEAYAVDNNLYPYSFSRAIDALTGALEPIYIKKLPTKDGWGNEFSYYHDATFNQYWIISSGADGKLENGIYSGDGIPLEAASGVTKDYNADIILSQGSFMRFPEGIAQ